MFTCQQYCDCQECEFIRTVQRIIKEHERGLMTPKEYAERLMQVAAEYLPYLVD